MSNVITNNTQQHIFGVDGDGKIPNIKMKWPNKWLTRLNGLLDPRIEQMRF